MFPQVETSLRLDKRPLEGAHVAIVEEESHLGSVLVHHFLSKEIKAGNSVVFLGLEQSIGHYHAVGMKSGVNLLKSRESGQIIFVEALKQLSDAYIDGFDTLLDRIAGEVFEALTDIVAKRPGIKVTVIIDKLTLLLSLGFSTRDVFVFVRKLALKLGEVGGNLVTLCHRTEDKEDCNKLANVVGEDADLSVVVWPLTSGKSSSVTGNMRFYWKGSRESGRYQFRTEEKDVKVFALGMSSAVL